VNTERAIWKFFIPITDEVIIPMPAYARILHVGVQNDSIFLGLMWTRPAIGRVHPPRP
jgi:hypothetical protein